jgi:DNA repair protein RadD
VAEYVLKRLAPSEIRCLGGVPAPKGLRFPAELLARVLRARSFEQVSLRVRWHDGRRVREELRELERGKRYVFVSGGPLGAARIFAAKKNRILVMAFQPVGNVTGRRTWLMTLDLLPNLDRDEEVQREVSGEVRRALGRGRVVRMTKREARSLDLFAKLALPAFGGGRFDLVNLSTQDWTSLVSWLATSVAPAALERLLEMQRGPLVRSLLEATGEESDPISAISLAEAVARRHGQGLLASYERRELLANERFGGESRVPVPPQWNPSSPTVLRFVRELGLPLALAGEIVESPPDFEDLIALEPLGALHDYQRTIASGIRGVLNARSRRGRRGLVWLPTGTGKTRVCAETLLTESFLAPPRNVLLWIADREELCEQAIEIFRHIWMHRGHETPSAIGTSSPMLRVVRVFGGRPSKALPDCPTLLCATIQTLARRAKAEVHRAWFEELQRRCFAVVFDEAHHVVAPSYVEVQRALGLELGDGPAIGNEVPVLLGLTATPGRTAKDETEELAKRFHGRLLEPSSPYRSVRGFIEKGYLARPIIEVAKTGFELELTDEERADWDAYAQLSESALVRAGRDVGRSAAILRDLEPRLEQLRSVLLYACSVEHAEALAEVLSMKGHSAAAVHGGSPRPVRQSLIQRFRYGGLKVLVSCDLLTTGFNAPNVDAVVLARPVLSRILFSQMIGRGLRGPKNGGTPRCLILDYEDSLGPHGDLERLRDDFRRDFVVATRFE